MKQAYAENSTDPPALVERTSDGSVADSSWQKGGGVVYVTTLHCQRLLE